MSSSCLSDLERLVQPPTNVERSDPPDCLGGIGDLLEKAMDFTTETEVAVLKTSESYTGDNVQEDLLDFDDFLASSKSRVKPDSPVVKTEKIPSETAMEIDNDEPILLPGRLSGASAASMSSVNVDVGNKKYKLFVCPKVINCVRLCKTFIRQGTTVCVNLNCRKHHRQKKTISILPGQLFVAKLKDVVFAEPTSEALLEEAIIDDWKTQNLTLSQ